MAIQDFEDLMRDILAEEEMEMVYVSVMSKPERQEGREAAYHNRRCSQFPDRENERRIPLKLAKWLDYTKLCGLCER